MGSSPFCPPTPPQSVLSRWMCMHGVRFSKQISECCFFLSSTVSFCRTCHPLSSPRVDRWVEVPHSPVLTWYSCMSPLKKAVCPSSPFNKSLCWLTRQLFCSDWPLLDHHSRCQWPGSDLLDAGLFLKWITFKYCKLCKDWQQLFITLIFVWGVFWEIRFCWF